MLLQNAYHLLTVKVEQIKISDILFDTKAELYYLQIR